MREPLLKELQGASRLARGFFNSLIRRIECTKPLAGSGISISEKDDGMEISVIELNKIKLNVCSNGQPDVVEVYGP